MNRWWRPALSLLVIAQATAAEQFAPEEQKAIENLVTNVVSSCKTQALAQLRQKAAEKTGTAPAWADSMISEDYCDCVGGKVRAAATPELVRAGTSEAKEQMKQAVGAGAKVCAVEQLKGSFLQMCRSMMLDVAKLPNAVSVSAEQQEQVCSCIQSRVNEITGETLAPTLQATVRDYIQWQHAPSEPPTVSPGSMVGTYVECFKSAGLLRTVLDPHPVK